MLLLITPGSKESQAPRQRWWSRVSRTCCSTSRCHRAWWARKGRTPGHPWSTRPTSPHRRRSTGRTLPSRLAALTTLLCKAINTMFVKTRRTLQGYPILSKLSHTKRKLRKIINQNRNIKTKNNKCRPSHPKHFQTLKKTKTIIRPTNIQARYF